MNRKDIEDCVRTHHWPEISPEMRHRVLSIAVAPAGRVTWSERVWFSRGWRLAAATAVVAVVALDQWSGVRPAPAPATPRALAEAQVIDAVAKEAGLSADTAAWLARRAVTVRSRSASGPDGTALWQTLELDTTGGW